MFKLKKGSLRTVIHNDNDLELYKQAGWTLIEDEVKKVVKEEPKKEAKKENTVNEQNNSKRKSVKK